MLAKDNSFGVLTLATPSDYLKAIGLALSVRSSNPGVPTAVACSTSLHPVLKPFFDYVVAELPEIRGFQHKVNLDIYSPFQSTFFFDSDVLVFKDLKNYVELWNNPIYAATGRYLSVGSSTFGLDYASVLKRIKREQLHVIEGSGHAYFRRPECESVFKLARDITKNYRALAGDIRYADEDVMAIAMTIEGLPPAPYGDFFSRYCTATPGTIEMDASRAICRFISVDTGKQLEPCMMHFAADEAPIAYTLQLHRLFRAFEVSRSGLAAMGISDLWKNRVRAPLSRFIRSF